jgi:hypothetical protein
VSKDRRFKEYYTGDVGASDESGPQNRPRPAIIITPETAKWIGP